MGKRHGKIDTPEYISFMGMKQRCYDSKHKSYSYYGGRGIKVCDRWRHSFLNFLEDMGEKPSPAHTLDRVDVNGNYDPSNCVWSTWITQSNNRRNKKIDSYEIIVIGEEGLTIHEWAKRYSISVSNIRARVISAKWSIEKAIITPIGKRGRPMKTK